MATPYPERHLTILWILKLNVNMSVESAINSDPLWYKDAVFYEIYVRGFTIRTPTGSATSAG